MNLTNVLIGCEVYPKPAASLAYGTAGFRAKASLLNHVAYRSGLLANLRSMATRQVVGLMITASHNPEEDNGVKLIDPSGDMLDLSWEDLATMLVNSDQTNIENRIKLIVANNTIDVSVQGIVLLGWDSRPSSETLARIANEGISSMEGQANNIGLCSTPILHYLVRCKNDPAYGVPSVEGYYSKLCTAFNELWNKCLPTNTNYESEVYFDGANGVGAITMKNAYVQLTDKIKVHFYNDAVGVPGKLNYKCGADYVKQMLKMPENVVVYPFKRYVSFDGDADRIVYYYTDQKASFNLMDGDRMAILIASYLRDILNETNMDASFGIVQTAYANGASTKYIENILKINAPCVKTGVKYLHPKAREYDIGIYFEANGHGTVVFSENLKENLACRLASPGEENLLALETLDAFIHLTNETIGDALSDFLLIESILHAKNWNIQSWKAMYVDLPNQQMKVTVKDRNLITTTDAERKVDSPENLQKEIDEVVSRYSSGRAFVRPSGTEDVVRVYAEAETEHEAKELVRQVARLVYEMVGGIGGHP